nr:TRAM domain-containing protein [Acanthopleuribacter pedis]
MRITRDRLFGVSDHGEPDFSPLKEINNVTTFPPPQEVSIEKILNNGAGLARTGEGQVVFVNGALDGERYHIKAWHKRRGSLWAHEATRLSDSPQRTAPDCPSANHCGGCQLRHVRAENEAAIKAAFFSDTCGRIGKWSVSETEITAFPRPHSRYRGKFQVNGGKLGFHEAGSNRIAPIRTCDVLPASVFDALPRLVKITQDTAFKGFIFYACSPDEKNPCFLFEGRAEKPKKVLSLIQRSGLPVARIGWRAGGNSSKQWLPTPTLTMRWCDWRVTLETDQFFQTNPASWPRFWDQVRAYQQQVQPRLIWDVHAGSGFLSAALRGIGDTCNLVLSEPDPRAITNLKRNLTNHNGVTVVHGTAEDVIKQGSLAEQPVDGLILDPPRVGLSDILIDWIATARPASLLAFSCDSGTFARDLKKLRAAGYEPRGAAEIMDVVPGSLRFESVLTLVDSRNSRFRLT